MQNQLHAETLKEIAKVKAYLAHLEAMKTFLEGGGVPTTKEAKAKPEKTVRKRALPGTFQNALLTLFSPGDTLTNADVRSRLKAAKHGPVDNMHVRKTLTKMAKAGKLVKVQEGDGVAYRLP